MRSDEESNLAVCGSSPIKPADAGLARPRRVLFLDHTAKLGGGELALVNLVSHLDARRYVPVVALFSEGPLHDRLRLAGVETHLLKLSPLVVDAKKGELGFRSVLRARQSVAALSFVYRLVRFIRQQRPDIIYCNSLKADVLGGIASKIVRIPVIWHVRDRIADDYLPTVAARLFRWLCRNMPDCVIANSRATLKTLQLGGRTDSPAAHVVHGGVNISAYSALAHRRRAMNGNAAEDMREGLGVQSGWQIGGPVIGLVGRISPWKGQDVFLRAAARVHRRFSNARFQIIGLSLFDEEEYERKVRAMPAELGIAGQVEFTGFCNDVAPLISKMDILVHASTTGEPFGQVIVEGMAAGKPVVATDGGGVREIVVDGETGLIVPMGDADAMAAAIESLLADPAAARAMGRRGRQRAADHFTLQIVADNVQAVCDQLLDTYGSSRASRRNLGDQCLSAEGRGDFHAVDVEAGAVREAGEEEPRLCLQGNHDHSGQEKLL